MSIFELRKIAENMWITRQSEQTFNAHIEAVQNDVDTADIFLASGVYTNQEFRVTVPLHCTLQRIAAEVDNLHRLYAQKVSAARERINK